jgi:hypothetical protein
LDAVTGNVDITGGVDRNSRWVFELTGPCTEASPRPEIGAATRELEDLGGWLVNGVYVAIDTAVRERTDVATRDTIGAEAPTI